MARKTESIIIPSSKIKEIMLNPELVNFLDKEENRDYRNGDRFLRVKTDRQGGYHSGTIMNMDSPVDCLSHPENYEFELHIITSRKNHKPVESYTLSATNIADAKKADSLFSGNNPEMENYRHNEVAYTVTTYIWDLSRRAVAKLGFIKSMAPTVSTFEKSTFSDLENASKEELVSYINQLEDGLYDISSTIDVPESNLNEDVVFDIIASINKIINSFNF